MTPTYLDFSWNISIYSKNCCIQKHNILTSSFMQHSTPKASLLPRINTHLKNKLHPKDWWNPPFPCKISVVVFAAISKVSFVFKVISKHKASSDWKEGFNSLHPLIIGLCFLFHSFFTFAFSLLDSLFLLLLHFEALGTSLLHYIMTWLYQMWGFRCNLQSLHRMMKL